MSSQTNIYKLEKKYSQCGDKNGAKRPKNFDITNTREGKIGL